VLPLNEVQTQIVESAGYMAELPEPEKPKLARIGPATQLGGFIHRPGICSIDQGHSLVHCQNLILG